MNLTSVALTPEEAAKHASPAVAGGGESDLPKYPWGLCIDLNDETLAKLGITELPPAGSQMMLAASVEVDSTGSSERAKEGREIRMSLQITAMSLSEPTADVEERAAAKLWPSAE